MQVVRGVMYTQQEAEGKRLKNPCDTITEGIGINRQTRNFSKARIDGAFQGTDREAVEMASTHDTCIKPREPTFVTALVDATAESLHGVAATNLLYCRPVKTEDASFVPGFMSNKP